MYVYIRRFTQRVLPAWLARTLPEQGQQETRQSGEVKPMRP